jgi:glutamate N-acetyltransferase / amino-acid N-acetyltransferase
VSVTAAAGFVASGTSCGIKPGGVLDLAVVATDDGAPVPAAGVFTGNRMTAAPVIVSRRHLTATAGRAAAVVVNSGNANAATGAQGEADAERTCGLLATELGCQPDEVLVCSTGLIGIPLPIDAIEAGVPGAVAALRADGAVDAAEAIRTTDTHRKEVVIDGDGFVVGGMAKGAAMLAPNMATMLAVLTTDASVDAGSLHAALATAVETSFNAITVDGCTSTNDTVLVLASGRAGPQPPERVAMALEAACSNLASQMVRDAEGATKVVRLTVTGAASHDDARHAARKVAESQLVKCSWYGCDPYWGRIASELGSAGVAFDPDRLRIAYGGVTVCDGGVEVDHDRDAVSDHMGRRDLEITAHLGLGEGGATILTNDLTHAYVDENMGTS